MKKSSRIKEAERIEGVLRGLLKLPENRRCINCNSLGPQYVCTTFLTFVCTNCSGVHREFTHRVKSVSMAKFSAEEVSSLQAAGNERARQIYLKGWDPQRNSYPDSSNLHRIREFIKHVYVDRKYTGEKSDSLPTLRLGEDEESYKSGKVGALSEARSPPYESRYGHSSSARCYESRYGHSSSGRCSVGRYGHSSCGRSGDRDFRFYHDERSSPSYNWENSRSGGYLKSPVRFEVVDDRFRDDTFASGRRNKSNREYKAQSRFPGYQSSSSSLEVQSIKEIFGGNDPPLEVGKRSKPIDGEDADSFASNQKIAPSGSRQHVNGNQVEQKENNSESLINFGKDPESMDAGVAASQTEEIIPFGDAGNQSSNEPSAKEKSPMAPKPNTLEFLLFELSGPSVAQSYAEAPSAVSGSHMPAGGQMSTLPSSISSATAPSTDMPVQPSEGNMPEASISSSAPAETMLMFPSCVDASTTASTTYSSVQPSGANTPTVGASSAASLGQLSLHSSPGALTTTSTTNVLMHPSGGNMPVSGDSPAPHLKQIKTLAKGIGDFPTVSTITEPVSPFHQRPSQVALDFNVGSVATDPNVQRLGSTQPCQPLLPLVADSRSSAAQQITTPVGALNNQPWESSLVPYIQRPSVASAVRQSQTVSRAVLDTSSTTRSEPIPVESKSSGRKEIPVDLFTASYMPPASVPQWQTGPHNTMGFNMHYYPNTMLVPAYPSQAKSTNPFDFNSDTAAMPAQAFPSMASLQGVLPNLDLQPTSGTGTHSQGSTLLQSSSYVSTIPLQSPFPSPSPSSTLLGQLHTDMTPPRLQGVDGFGNDRAVFGFSNIQQNPTGGHSMPTPANSFSSMGGKPIWKEKETKLPN